MKKSKIIWNYIDLILQTSIILIFIIVVYYIAERLERYIYRYTIFPFIAILLIFILGILVGRGVERTRKGKPIGVFSKRMYKSQKNKNRFIFEDKNELHNQHKEIIEDIKSGEITHVKQFSEEEYDIDEFNDIYKVKIEELVDDKMEENEDNKENKE